MQIELLISELGKSLGIEGLKIDINNCCSLLINDNVINIQWQKADDSLLIYSPVAVELNNFSSGLYEYLLTANLFGVETKSMHIGVHLPASAVVLSKSIPIDEAQNVKDFLNFFEHEVRRWQRNIADFKIEHNTAPQGVLIYEPETFYMKV